MQKLINNIISELKNNIDPVYRNGEKRFFKEPIKNLSKAELFNLSEKMFKEKYNELSTIASSWLWSRKEEFKAEDFKNFEGWIDKYFDNWAKIDDFCTHSLGYLINRFPELTPQLFTWTKSKNRWVKRAAAVSLIYPWGKPKKFLPQIIKTAIILLNDSDDMVQKSYGWMLKEASVHNQKEVFDFVMKYKSKMPRTALRYAIEKLPEKLKKKAMR